MYSLVIGQQSLTSPKCIEFWPKYSGWKTTTQNCLLLSNTVTKLRVWSGSIYERKGMALCSSHSEAE